MTLSRDVCFLTPVASVIFVLQLSFKYHGTVFLDLKVLSCQPPTSAYEDTPPETGPETGH